MTVVPVSKRRSKAPPNSSRTRSGRPHSNGDGGGEGGGVMYGFITLNSPASVPSGGQVVSARRPPLRQTRASSAAASSGRLTNMTPQVEIAASKAASGQASFPASPAREPQ